MKRVFAILLGLFVVIHFSACKKDRLTANGNIISETRNLGQFTGISSSGATPVEVKYGTEFRVVVKGSSNIVPHYTTRVVNNVLHIGFERIGISRDDVEVILTMPILNRIELSGSTEVEVEGSFPAIASLNVSISGSGKVEVDHAIQVDQVKVDISGSGTVDFEEVLAKTADADISGSGSLRLQVQDRIKAKISGSGKIYYRGNPVVQQDISGSGKLIKF
ncbi:head GIN domain-containing protein [Pedobacter nanyangensis]|uniref:head GIN domain-containing protein n=1 Tax=Pedobacter nanyangensis TaxID=1562389 RepID=UPI000DE2036A|nr:head GIN domain-containing protein [Pedobacter nanyangensis]